MTGTSPAPRADRDLVAFEELVRRHADVVWRYAVGMLGEPGEAEEVTQDTFVRVHRHLESWRGEATLRTWIISICRNLCLDRLRRHRATVVPLETVRAERLGAERDPADAVAMRDLLRDGVADLTDEEREAFHLCDVLGLSGADAAAAVGVPPTTLRGRLRRAHDKLVAHVLREDPR